MISYTGIRVIIIQQSLLTLLELEVHQNQEPGAYIHMLLHMTFFPWEFLHMPRVVLVPLLTEVVLLVAGIGSLGAATSPCSILTFLHPEKRADPWTRRNDLAAPFSCGAQMRF